MSEMTEKNYNSTFWVKITQMRGKSKQSEKVDLCIVSLVIKAHQKMVCKSTFFSKISL